MSTLAAGHGSQATIEAPQAESLRHEPLSEDGDGLGWVDGLVWVGLLLIGVVFWVGVVAGLVLLSPL